MPTYWMGKEYPRGTGARKRRGRSAQQTTFGPQGRKKR